MYASPSLIAGRYITVSSSLLPVQLRPNEYLSYSKHNTADTNKPVNILIQSAYPRLNDVAPIKSFSIYIAYPAEP